MMMTLNRIAGEYGHLTSAQFVAVTHDDIGAWANYYTPGACRSIYTGRSIPIDALDDEYRARKIGRAHVCTPVTNPHLVCRLMLEKKNSRKSIRYALHNSSLPSLNT